MMFVVTENCTDAVGGSQGGGTAAHATVDVRPIRASLERKSYDFLTSPNASRASIRSAPTYGRKTSGTTMLPSACW